MASIALLCLSAVDPLTGLRYNHRPTSFSQLSCTALTNFDMSHRPRCTLCGYFGFYSVLHPPCIQPALLRSQTKKAFTRCYVRLVGRRA